MGESLVGSVIEGFRLDGELGRGGMGVVYLAEELALRRRVAVKLLHHGLLEDPTARARFQREIANAVAIEHPHVVPVYRAGFDAGHFYLAMRYVEGEDLFRIVRNGGPLEEARAMRLVGQIASALEFVHERGLVHRDVKPQNVLVWNAGEVDEHAFLTDFGIAKALEDTQPITRGGALGTRGYMAPELFQGRAASTQSDQFSLACLAYELLAGRLPFADPDGDSDEPADLPVPVAFVAPHVSREVRASIERGLSLDPGARFRSVRDFARAHAVADESFDRSTAITDTLTTSNSDAELVDALHKRHGLSEAAIAELANMRRSEVLRLRRQSARRALIGE